MYDKIFDFCRVRNLGNCSMNGLEPSPRVKFLLKLLDNEGIKYELDEFKSYRPDTNYYNIILKGSSNRMVVAHHDIVNKDSDNANDNSCSVINAITLKKLRPNINVVILDGEELGGIGSKQLSSQINSGYFGKIEWVLNLELTGRGGKYFFIGNYPGVLTNHIKTLFDCPIVDTPFNDSVIFNKYGIDSVVINPLPPLELGIKSTVMYNNIYLDYNMLFNCHSIEDSLDTISTSDMREFIEDIVLKIIDNNEN